MSQGYISYLFAWIAARMRAAANLMSTLLMQTGCGLEICHGVKEPSGGVAQSFLTTTTTTTTTGLGHGASRAQSGHGTESGSIANDEAGLLRVCPWDWPDSVVIDAEGDERESTLPVSQTDSLQPAK